MSYLQSLHLAIEPHLKYWEYIQSHPAHVGLPPSSAEEAIEALTWCYTGDLRTCQLKGLFPKR